MSKTTHKTNESQSCDTMAFILLGIIVCLSLELFGGNFSLACGELQVISGLTKSCGFYT
jgi:hypothetical protein